VSENRKLTKNVTDFLRIASADYGKIKEQEFSQDLFCQLIEREMTSPIEHLFYLACSVLCPAHWETINPEPRTDHNGVDHLGCGIFVAPQIQIGKYRVDFVISQYGIGPEGFYPPVVVELDGHDFHDKDKTQRAYEKARDRFLVKAGYRVLHFTGSEVVADPYKVAYEALDLVGLSVCSGSEGYDPKNPLGFE